MRTQNYFSPELIASLEKKEIPKNLEILTETEMKVLNLIAKNKTGVMMAESMNISVRTVEKHKSNIIKKLNLNPKQNSLLIWVKENEQHLLKYT